MQITTNAHPRATDKPLAVVHETGTAWIAISDLAIFPPREDRAAWLRSLSAACDDLAEQVDLAANPGLALADQHIADAKAAAGIARDRRAGVAS